jgi:hypothetical protein
MVIYFNACLFFWVSHQLSTESDVENGDSFTVANNMDGEDYITYLLTTCYYISTTIDIIGYGEMAPKNNLEMIWICIIEFIGQFMAVFFLGQFIEIIINNSSSASINKQVNSENKEIEL